MQGLAPVVSVVLPTAGDVAQLDRCLEALLHQTLDAQSYEVIVVEAVPDSCARKLVAVWQAGIGPRGPLLRFLAFGGTRGLSAARNRGWRASTASLIAFTHEDALPAPRWLHHALDVFDSRTDAVCGRVRMRLPRLPTEQQRAAWRQADAVCTSANLLCRRSVLVALGGFDERFVDGWRASCDLHFALLALRARVTRAPTAVVTVAPVPARWCASLAQMDRCGADALLQQKHPRLYRQRIATPHRWIDRSSVGGLFAALMGQLLESGLLAAGGVALWCAATTLLSWRRLRGTSRAPAHVADVLLTSALIPPLAMYWRIRGALRYRVRFR